MSDASLEKNQFIELLPFYINGTLEEPLRRQVDSYLAEYPSAKAELIFSAALASATCAPLNERDPMAGYEILQKRLQLKTTLPVPQQPKIIENDGWLRTATQFFSGFRLAPVMTIGAMIVAAMIAGPILLRPDHLTSSDAAPDGNHSLNENYRGRHQPVIQGALKLVIRSTASFEDIVLLLSQNHCKIVWGPSASGELWLDIDGADIASSVKTRLSASPLVEDVQLIQRGVAQ